MEFAAQAASSSSSAGLFLVVEDEQELRRDLCEELQQRDFQTLEARDDQEGLEMDLQHRPDTNLFDIKMPKKTGLEAIAELRAPHVQTPCIIWSAFGDNEAMRLGVTDFLDKPYHFERLFQAVEQSVQLGQEIKAFEQELDQPFLQVGTPPQRQAALQRSRLAHMILNRKSSNK